MGSLKKQRVLLLVHPRFRPDRGNRRSSTENDIWQTLKTLGHVVEFALVDTDLRPLDMAVKQFQPTVVFNLLEEFREQGIFDFHVVSYLEALGIPCTGCNPRG